MGRPLNKKYFGNTDPGNIGGVSIASVSVGSGGNYAALPTVTVKAPSIPTGQTAQLAPHMAATAASTTANGTGYNYQDSLSVSGGTGTSPTLTVSAITAVSISQVVAYWDGTNGYADGDTFGYSTGMATPIQVQVKRRSGANGISGSVIAGTGAPTGFVILNGGSRSAAAATGTITDNVRGGTPSASQFDSNSLGGRGAQLKFAWGVYSATPASAGNLTALPSNPVNVTGSGSGAKFNITYQVVSLDVVDPGLGYENAGDATITFAPAGASATPTMTVNTSPAITPYARIAGASAATTADIVKQTGKDRFVVVTGDGTGVVTLVASNTPDQGQAYLVATDANGSTYWVLTLQAHLVLLVQRTMNGSYLFASNSHVRWTQGGAVPGTVKIENY